MIASIALLLSAAASSQEEAAVTSTGELRWIGSQLTDFAVDADGTMVGQQTWLDQRIRLGATARLSGLMQLTGELDALTGQLAGDTWDLPSEQDERLRAERTALTPQGFRPRQLYATTVLANTQLQLGLQTSQWGLGMLANDGATEPWFGRSDFGDRVIRLRATQLPGGDGPTPRTSWLFTGAADLVVADDIASLAGGEQALQLIGSALGIGRKGSRVGAYTVFRQQWEEQPGRSTQAFVTDLYADAWHPIGQGWRVRTAAEVAGIAGRTDRATTYNARDKVGILSLGATGTLSLAEPDDRLQFHLRTGYASGDGDPDDGTTHDFTFDRDFGVGMVMFDQVTGAIEAQAHALLSDPTIASQPPDGIETVVSEGAFRRAVFFQPVVQLDPHPWVGLRTGVVWAWGTAFYAHPLYTYRNGGAPANQGARPVETRGLGGELDWAVSVHRPGDQGVRPSFELQGGHFSPAPALRGAGMPPIVSLLTGAIRVTW